MGKGFTWPNLGSVRSRLNSEDSLSLGYFPIIIFSALGLKQPLQNVLGLLLLPFPVHMFTNKTDHVIISFPMPSPPGSASFRIPYQNYMGLIRTLHSFQCVNILSHILLNIFRLSALTFFFFFFCPLFSRPPPTLSNLHSLKSPLRIQWGRIYRWLSFCLFLK